MQKISRGNDATSAETEVRGGREVLINMASREFVLRERDLKVKGEAHRVQMITSADPFHLHANEVPSDAACTDLFL